MTITDFGVAIVNGDSHLSKWVVEHGRLDVDGSAHEMAAAYIKPGDVVLDVGACIGDHTIVYLKAVGPAGAVHAFEPNPVAFECLAFNCPKAVLHREALGATRGRGCISMGEGPDTPPHCNLGAATIEMVPGGVVHIMRLDDFGFPRVDFIKLDVEGMELEALEGSIMTLKRCHPVVMVEFNGRMMQSRGLLKEDIFKFMDGALNYRWQLRDPRYSFDQDHTDVMFIPKSL